MTCGKLAAALVTIKLQSIKSLDSHADTNRSSLNMIGALYCLKQKTFSHFRNNQAIALKHRRTAGKHLACTESVSSSLSSILVLPNHKIVKFSRFLEKKKSSSDFNPQLTIVACHDNVRVQIFFLIGLAVFEKSPIVICDRPPA